VAFWIAASKARRESREPQGQYRVRQCSVVGRQASVPDGHRWVRHRPHLRAGPI